jgi:hypothetical protein
MVREKFAKAVVGPAGVASKIPRPPRPNQSYFSYDQAVGGTLNSRLNLSAYIERSTRAI